MNLVYIRDGRGRYTNYEALISWIKSNYYKLYFPNQLHLPCNGKDLNSDIQLFPKLLVVEVDFHITQDEKKYSKNNIYTNMYWKESFFKEVGLSVFVIYLKQGNNHLVSLHSAAVDFLTTHVGFANAEI